MNDVFRLYMDFNEPNSQNLFIKENERSIKHVAYVSLSEVVSQNKLL